MYCGCSRRERRRRHLHRCDGTGRMHPRHHHHYEGKVEPSDQVAVDFKEKESLENRE